MVSSRTTSLMGGLFSYALALTIGPWIIGLAIGVNYGPTARSATAFAVFGIVAAVGIIGFRRYKWDFFIAFGKFFERLGEDDESANAGATSGNKKSRIKRPPTYWTNQMIEAVGGRCEIQGCNKKTHLQVHHIKDHAQGGNNSLKNLLVVCPNHHGDCQRGAINRQRQTARVNRQGRFNPHPEFPARWKKSVLDKQ